MMVNATNPKNRPGTRFSMLQRCTPSKVSSLPAVTTLDNTSGQPLGETNVQVPTI
jgi:hypothetical protein